MPLGLSTALIGFGAAPTSVSDVAGSIVAGLGLVSEAVYFYSLGRS